MKDFALWLLSIFRHWKSWLSGFGVGGGVVIILLVVERLKWWTMPNFWYVLVFIVFFLLGSSFVVWRDEHAKVAVLEAELDNKKPKLGGGFGYFAVAPAGQNDQDSIAAFQVHITNLGGPSILKNIEVQVNVGSKTVTGQNIPLSRNGSTFTGESNGQKITFTAAFEDHLVRKCFEQPIITGGGVTGIHEVLFTGISCDDIQRVGTTTALSFEDILGKKYTFSITMDGEKTSLINPSTLQRRTS